MAAETHPLARLDGLELSCHGVVRRYRSRSGTVTALDGFDATFRPGRVGVVAGSSGAGKSTLLRVLAFLEAPDEGWVSLGGQRVTSTAAGRRLRARCCTHLFQRPPDNLVEHLDAAENIELAAQLRGLPRPDAVAVLDHFGLADRAGHRPAQLSGGEQQRLAVATVLASQPAVVTADEPTAELDDRSAVAVVEGLVQLAAAGATVVVTSHDPAVLDVADDVVRLSRPRSGT